MNILPSISGNKRTTVFIIFAIVAIILVVDPFHWLSKPASAPKRNFSAQEIDAISNTLRTESIEPRIALTQIMAEKKLLLLGTQNFIKEEIEFARNVIPFLPAMKVHVLGLEYLRAEDQSDIDRLIAAPEFDPQLAQTLIFKRLPLWGYQEYVDLLKAAWEANHLPAQGGFKVVGLALSQNFSVIHTNADFQDPEIRKIILASGRQDSFMAQTVFTQLSTNENTKMVVLCQRISAFTTVDDSAYTTEMAKLGFNNEKRMGVILKEKLGNSVGTLLFHTPFPAEKSPVGAAFPLDGLLDKAMETGDKSPLPIIPSAYNLQTSKLGIKDSGTNDFNQDAKDQKKDPVKLANLADIYVIFGPIHTLHAVQAIPNFVTDANLPEALKILPTVREPASMSPQILNEEISEQAKDFEKALVDFR